MNNYYKIICLTILLISLLAIIAIATSGILFNNSDTQGSLEVVANNQNENIISNVKQIEWNDNFQSAVKESKKSDKPMLVYFGTSWCYYCKQLESETFMNPDVQNKIAENYIPVKIDGDTNPELCSRYNVLGFPTIVIIDSNEKELDSIVGFYQPSEFLNRIS